MWNYILNLECSACIICCIFVVGKHRDLKFGEEGDHSVSQRTHNKPFDFNSLKYL